jgi:NADH-quinone oxidoreductase subunit D
VREVTVSTGLGGDPTTVPASGAADLALTIGAQHPSTHGVLRLRVELDGDVVVSAEPLVGHLHRGAEKLFEVRDYRQILTLANRHDWLSAFSSELGVALAVERLMGIEVPARATWLRTALAELNRILHHLIFLGAYPVEIASSPALRPAFAERERIQAVMEEATGGRMHFMFNRVGGLREEVPAGWSTRARTAVAAVAARLPELAALVRGNENFLARTVGVGVLTPHQVTGHGASGPVARASGVDLDLRRDEPYLAYGDLTVPVVTRAAGDCQARFDCLVEQIEVSTSLVRICLDRVDQIGGPVNVRLPKVVRAPEGHTYAWTENPSGINGYYLVSRGEKTPWRLKMRTASFANVSTLSALLPGCRVADLVPILGSHFFVIGDNDK